MAQLLPFRLKVEFVELIRWHDYRYPLGHFDSVKLKILQFVRIVRQKFDRSYVKRHQHVGGDVVVSLVGLESQLLVRLNGVETRVLQLVGFDLVDEADPTAFLPQIEDDSTFHLAYSHKGFLKLLSAVTTKGADCVSRKTLGVQPYWNILFLENIAMDKRGMLLLVEIVPERDGLIVTVKSREVCDSHDLYADLRCLTACVVFALLQQLADGRFRDAHQGRREKREQLLLSITFQEKNTLSCETRSVKQHMNFQTRFGTPFDCIVFCCANTLRLQTRNGQNSR